ncbi:MAG: aminopeptidase, partial [Gammaproteobacteria bacterium]|nr:aminopeptidase [Gammaproteobacteria bacterium]
MSLVNKILVCFTAMFLLPYSGFALAGEPGSGARKFAQLEQLLPTPNSYRTASGAPGFAYWQQQADYKIQVALDEDNQSIVGSEQITYTNNSPDTLNYLWLQLDQNRFAEGSLDRRSQTTNPKEDKISFNRLRQAQSFADNEHGYSDLTVTDKSGNPLPFVVIDTMMRIDLKKALKPKGKIVFNIGWAFNIIEEAAIGGRGGYEHFEDNDSYIFFLAQWFPRMVAYTDYAGWQHKAFLGRGEFTLEFGNYEVAITVPAGHIVSATGELTNASEVLTKAQRERLAQANTATPVFVVTPQEALANENLTDKPSGSKTWRFNAQRIRDFAWSSSRKFIWDAMLHSQPGAKHDNVLAMSFYPNEAEPAWSQYSTQAVIHTLDI